MRYLILAHIGDDIAIRTYALLKKHYGSDDVKLVSSEELIYAPHWSHQLDDTNPNSTIILANNTVLSSDEIGVVFNRLRYVVMPHFDQAKQNNREFAIMEMYGLLLSWLQSLPCPIINPPSPRGLGARTLSDIEWFYLASQAGLPVQGFAFSSDPRIHSTSGYVPYWRKDEYGQDGFLHLERVSPHLVGRHPTFYLEPLEENRKFVFVIGKKVIGDIGNRYSEELLKLSKVTGCDLLTIVFAPSSSEDLDNINEQENIWKVCKIDAFPQTQDHQVVESIVRLLESREENS